MAGSKALTGEHLIIVKKCLEETTSILNSINLEHIVDCGTLLGIIRENRLLPWDDDVDLTIKRVNLKKLMKNRWRFWLKGYRTHVGKFKQDYGQFKKGDIRIFKIQTKRWLFIKKYNVLDIFIKDLVGDEYQMIVGGKRSVLQGIPKHFLDETIEYKFDDKMYTIPKDYEEYLEYIYGDWKTPVKEWDFTVDAKCNKKAYFNK